MGCTFIAGFSTPRSFNPISSLIRRLGGARFSHAWLAFRDDVLDDLMVLDATSTLFTLVPMSKFSRGNRVVESYELDWDMTPGVRLLRDYLGEPYDYPGALGLAIVRLQRKLRRAARNPLGTRGCLFCSESLVRALVASSFPGSWRLPPECCWPLDVRDFIVSSGACRPAGLT